MADIHCLEHQTLKVPYEMFNKQFRSAQKVLDREVANINATLTDIEHRCAEDEYSKVEETKLKLINNLNILEEKLIHFKQRAGEAFNEEIRSSNVCQQRLEHLKQGCTEFDGVHCIASETRKQWQNTRVDRMLVEYLLRSGYYDNALRLANAVNIVDLTNIELFLVAKEVEEALARKDVSKCLIWCHNNKSKLRKLKSTLEFDIRMQEFIELIKRNLKVEAVQHAKRHLSSVESDQLLIVRQGCMLLALPVETQLHPYCDLLQDSRWQNLIEQFRHENIRLFHLSHNCALHVVLQAGLSALKTPQCYALTGDKNIECPVCCPALNTLAINLPLAHCAQSRLICHLTGRPMNENNHPMMLPNGFVYGENALLQMASENENGTIVCPRTKEVFTFKEAEKVFIM